MSPGNWTISSSVVDALKILGALAADEGTRAEIKRELASVLADDEVAVDQDLALSLCMNMFDHKAVYDRLRNKGAIPAKRGSR